MKKTAYFLIATACMLFAGCSERDIDMDTNGGKGLEFVHFSSQKASLLVSSDEASQKYEVVVSITVPSNRNRTFDLEIGDKTTGHEGVDFELSGKQITIPAGAYQGKAIVSVPFESMDENGFTLQLLLEADAALINPTYGNSLTLTFLRDIDITWEWLEGNWSGSDDGGAPYSVTLTKVDDTHLTIFNFWGGNETITATVNLTKRTLQIDPGQMVYYYNTAEDGDLGPVYLLFCDPETETPDKNMEKPIEGSMSALGISIGMYNVYLASIGYDFGSGYTMLTR